MGRKSKSDIRKPEILKCLYRVINREGLEGTTLAKVADEMGVNFPEEHRHPAFENVTIQPEYR